MNNDGKRLFSGVYPCGIVYADRWVEQHGDYKRLAFLSFKSLVLEMYPECPLELKEAITKDAEGIVSQRGKAYSISACGQTVILGEAE
ncbi:MAG: hypothetical protein PHI97_00575 [Desulfobulbus sp.]|jgi:hypothetical protein|nr:hypothetical protein [Desulfobulbus sp.]